MYLNCYFKKETKIFNQLHIAVREDRAEEPLQGKSYEFHCDYKMD